MWKKKAIFVAFLCWLPLVCGCTVVPKTRESLTKLEYEVVDPRVLPKELEERIEEKKDEGFELVYRDMDAVYIAKGYGKKEREKYCIEIVSCVENETLIYWKTILHGPEGEGIVCETAYPFCVIKVGYSEKMVVFEE